MTIDASAGGYSAFISYASADEEKARDICASLEERGHRCWIASRDVRVGHEYASEIIHGIQESRCLILVLSKAANESHFVRREVERAVSKGKPVFPVRIEEVLPCAALELFVSASHWIDLWSGEMVEHMQRLATDLTNSRTLAEAAEHPRKITRRRRLPRWAMTAVGLMIGVAAIIMAVEYGFRRAKNAEDKDWGALRVAPKITNAIIDPDKVKESDLKPVAGPNTSFRYGQVRISIDIKMSPTVGAALSSATMTYRLGTGDYQTSSLYYKIDLREADPAKLAAVKTLTLRYEFHDGKVVGPFEYPLPIGEVFAQAATGERMEKALRDFTGVHFEREVTAYLGSMGENFSAIRRFQFGESENNLDISFWVPFGGDATRDRDLARISRRAYVAYRPGAKTLAGRVELVNGNVSPIRNWDFDQKGLLISERLNLLSGTNNDETPVVFASYDANENHRGFGLRAMAPRGATAWKFALEDIRFPEAEPEGNFWYTDIPLDAEKQLGPQVFLEITDVEGRQCGPFSYDTAAITKMTVAGIKQKMLQDLETSFVFLVVTQANTTALSELTPFHFGQHQMTVMGNLSQRGFAFMKSPGIGIRHGYRGLVRNWGSVSEIHLGKDIDRLDLTVPVTPQPLSNSQTFQYSEEPLWHAVLPLGIDFVYIEVKFRDGTLSKKLRFRVADFDRLEAPSKVP